MKNGERGEKGELIKIGIRKNGVLHVKCWKKEKKEQEKKKEKG